jgi:hypothetical protein
MPKPSAASQRKAPAPIPPLTQAWLGWHVKKLYAGERAWYARRKGPCCAAGCYRAVSHETLSPQVSASGVRNWRRRGVCMRHARTFARRHGLPEPEE